MSQERTLRRIRWPLIALSVIAILSAVLVVVRLLAGGAPGRNILESQLETRSFRGQTISIDGLHGDILGKSGLDVLTVSDADGTWLTITGLELDWRPFALLDHKVIVQRLAARQIDYLRAPVLTPAPQKDATDNGSSFIHGILLGELSLPLVRATLPELDAPVEASLAAAIDVGSTDGHVYLNIDTSRGDAGDRADIDLVWTRALIDGKADLRAPASGVIMNFLPADMRDDLIVTFSASNDNRNWAASGKATLGAHDNLTLTGKADDHTAQIDMDIQMGQAALLDAMASRIGNQATIRVALDFSKSTAPTELTAQSANLDLRASGDFDLDTRRPVGRWPLQVDARNLPALTGLAALSADQARFVGDLDIRKNGAYGLTGELDATRPAYDLRGADSLKLHVDGELADRKISASLDLAAAQPRIGQSRLQQLVGDHLDAIATAVFDLSTRNLQLRSLDARAQHASLSAAGRFSPQDATSLKGRLAIDDLSLIDTAVAGRANSAWTLDRKDAGSPWRATLDGEAADFSSTLDTLSSLLEPTVAFSGKASYAPNGKAAFDITANSGSTHAGVVGTLSSTPSGPGVLDATLKGSLATLTVSSADLHGIGIDLKARGPLSGIALTGDLTVNKGAIAGRDVSGVTLNLSDARTGGPRRAQFRLAARVDGSPLEANGLIDLDTGLAINNLEAEWSQLKLTGDIARPSGGALAGALALKGPIPLEGIEGTLDASATLSGETIDLDARLDGFSRQNLSFDTLTLKALGAPTDMALQIDATGALLQGLRQVPISLSANGQLERADTTTLTYQANGSYDREPFATTGPAHLTLDGDRMSADAVLDLLGGAVTASAARQTDGLDLDVTVKALDLTRTAALAGRNDVKGSADLQLTWRGAGSTGDGAATINLTDVSRTEAGSPQLNITLTTNVTSNLVNTLLDMHGRDGLSLTGHGQTQLTVSGGIPNFDPDTTLVAYDLNGGGQLGALWALAGVDTIELDGAFTVSATERSTLSKLRPTGAFTLTEGRFEQAQLGARLVDINIATTFDPDKLTLTQASARGASGGTVTGQGVLNLDPAQQSSLFLDFRAFQAIKRDGQEVSVSGKAKVEKASRGATLTGDLTIDRALLDITTLNGTNGVKTVDVVFPDPETEKETRPQRKSRAPPFNLDVALGADREVFIRGRGLDVEMSADMKITGTLETPVIRGKAKVVRGGFDLAGQFFDFSTGEIDINGDPKTALINFAATRTTDGVTATLGLEGTAVHPELVLSSSPALPEDEILSRLLFGRSPSDLSALEAAQLAAAIASMANGGGGFNLVADLRDRIGLDRLSISQSDTGAAEVATGKYLAPDVYLELRSSPDGVADVAVQWEPRDNVSVGTEFQPDGDARVTVQWKKDFE